MQAGNTGYIYKNDFDEASFQHNMAYGKYEDLAERTESDKKLRNMAFKIASNPNYDGYQRRLASMVCKFVNKKSAGSGVTTFANKSMSNQLQLANELHEPIMIKFKRRRVYSSFKDSIWGGDLADMELISKYNKRIGYLLCVIDLSSKFVWFVPLKDKKGITVVNAFQGILDSAKRKRNKIRVDQGNEFYTSPFKKLLKDL